MSLVFAITCDYPDCTAMHQVPDPYGEFWELSEVKLPKGWKLVSKKDDPSPRYTCPEHGSRRNRSRARAGRPRP
jgi:hypothetical protein